MGALYSYHPLRPVLDRLRYMRRLIIFRPDQVGDGPGQLHALRAVVGPGVEVHQLHTCTAGASAGVAALTRWVPVSSRGQNTRSLWSPGTGGADERFIRRKLVCYGGDAGHAQAFSITTWSRMSGIERAMSILRTLGGSLIKS